MTTPTLHQAAQVALDALEPLSAYGRVGTRDVDQAALQQVCAALREALAQPQAEPVDQQIESINAVFDAWRNGEDASMTLALSAPPADGDRVEAAIDDYIDGYVMEGDDGYYQPNDGDTAMLKDAMMGLLVDPGFLAAYDATPPAAPQAVPAPAVPERWVIVRETVLDVGQGTDVRSGGAPEIGYALLSHAVTFPSEDAARTAHRSADLPLGWVIMPLSRLLPDLSAAPAVPDPWRMAVDAAMVGHALDCTTPDSDPKQCVELLCKQVADIWRDIAAPAVREPLTLSDDDLLRIATTLGLPFGMLDTDYCKSMEIEPGTRSYGEVTCDGMVRFARAAIAAAHGITGGGK